MEKGNLDLQRLLDKLQDGTITPEEEQFLINWYEQLDVAGRTAWESPGEEQRVKRILSARLRKKLTGTGVHGLHVVYRHWWWSAAAAVIVAFSIIYLQHAYKHKDEASDRLSWMTIDNKEGAVKKVSLPDGTTVWLDIDSRIRYNSQFGKTNRSVHEEGEALFDVAQSVAEPFVVSSRTLTTTVLGTVFNVDGYPDQAEVKVSLIRGKVRITDSTEHSAVLKPGQSASSLDGGPLAVSATDNSNAGEWVGGSLIFNETLLSDALLRIARKYKVQFDIPPGLLRNQRVTTVIRDTSDWQPVLQTILFIHNIHFGKVNHKIRLYE